MNNNEMQALQALNYFLYSELLNAKPLQSRSKNKNVIKCQNSELNQELTKVMKNITNDNKNLDNKKPRIEMKLYGLIYPLDSEFNPSLYSFLLEKLNKEDDRLEKPNIEVAGYCITLSKTMQEYSDYNLDDWEFSSEDIIISNTPWACIHFEELTPKLYKKFKNSQTSITREIENLKEYHLQIGELITEINKIIRKNIPFDLFTDKIQVEINWNNQSNKDNNDSSDSMINSFFIEDIFVAIDKFKNGNANTLLKEYLKSF